MTGLLLRSWRMPPMPAAAWQPSNMAPKVLGKGDLARGVPWRVASPNHLHPDRRRRHRLAIPNLVKRNSAVRPVPSTSRCRASMPFAGAAIVRKWPVPMAERLAPPGPLLQHVNGRAAVRQGSA